MEAKDGSLFTAFDYRVCKSRNFNMKKSLNLILEMNEVVVLCKISISTRVIVYGRRIGLYLYKYRIYGTTSIYILKGLASVHQLI